MEAYQSLELVVRVLEWDEVRVIAALSNDFCGAFQGLDRLGRSDVFVD